MIIYKQCNCLEVKEKSPKKELLGYLPFKLLIKLIKLWPSGK